MATLLEPERKDDETVEGVVDLMAEEVPKAEAPAEPTTPDPVDDVPDKYKGKTAAELIAMHQEAERFNGRQGSELGELRKNVDQLIQAQLAPVAAAQPVVEEEPVDFFEDPEAAIDRKIQNHPDVIAARENAAKLARQTAKQALRSKHSDMDAILADTSFLSWVQESPVRTRLFREAHSQFDHEAADELFTTWKERKGIAQQTLEVEQKERKQAVAAADTGSATGSTAKAPTKKYRRADVIRLMNEDPERYLALSGEIMAAYAAGNVIN